MVSACEKQLDFVIFLYSCHNREHDAQPPGLAAFEVLLMLVVAANLLNRSLNNIQMVDLGKGRKISTKIIQKF
jgi:hypothetical protein